MAAPFDFPATPINGQTYTPVAGLTYTWNGYGWQLNAPAGGSGGGGGVAEAPQDGQQYGRQSAGWTVVVPNPAAATSAPLMDGTAAVGTGTTWARADHVHPSDTSKLGDAPADGITYGRKNNAWSTIVGGAIVSDTAPTGILQNGQLWFESDTGSLFIYYSDADSSQWIMVVPGSPGMPKATGDLDMAGYSIKNVNNITGTGTAAFVAVSSDGAVKAGTYFTSTSTSAVLATTGAGSIYLRPQDANSSAGQFYLDNSGNASVAGTITTGGGITSNGTIVSTNGNFISRRVNSSANTHLWFQGAAGEDHGVMYVDTSFSYIFRTQMQRTVQFSNAGSVRAYNCYSCSPGIGGSFGSNVFTLNYNGNGTTSLWIDATNFGTITTSSDYRIKKDVEPLASMWKTVKGLRPISYTKADFEQKGTQISVANDLPHYGFIAHELREDLLLTAVNGEKDSKDEIQSLNLAPVVAALTKALQEAMARIEALEAANGV